ncbi:MAG: type II toxin-antitoxin system YafQ family toxin [Helicobacter sp.]|nr:type II toxin-antitoxin system YafQ family toxin [Helicobacter sp.]
MYKLHLTKRFIKDAKKLNKQDKEHIMEVLQKLCNNQTLELKYKDHALVRDLQGTRDCHIKHDLVLIYKRSEEILELVVLRISPHNEPEI